MVALVPYREDYSTPTTDTPMLTIVLCRAFYHIKNREPSQDSYEDKIQQLDSID